jgi:hypothetical protein
MRIDAKTNLLQTGAGKTAAAQSSPTKNAGASTPVNDAVAELGLGAIGTVTSPLDVVQAVTPTELIAQLGDFSAASAELGSQKPVGTAASFLNASFPDLDKTTHVLLPGTFVGNALKEMAQAHDGDEAVDTAEAHRLEARFELVRQNLLQSSVQATTDAHDQFALAQISPAAISVFRKVVKDAALGHAHASSADAATGTADVEIPSPAFVGLEQAAQSSGPSLAGMDIDSLVQMVMAQCAEDSETDLRDVINQMTQNNNEKKQMRDYIAAQKQQQAEIKQEMQTEYDRRCGLAEGNPERIDPKLTSFDDFSSTQKIVQTGTVTTDADGVPSGDTSYSISPNTTYYPQDQPVQYDDNQLPVPQADVDEAQKLNITPANMVALREIWQADPAMQVKFGGSMERWLLESTANGGVGLQMTPAADQNGIVATYRNSSTNNPATLQSTYGLTADTAAQVQTKWASLPQGFRDHFSDSIDSWLTGAPPLGMGLSVNAFEPQDNMVTSYLGGMDAMFQTLKGMSRYGLAQSDVDALQDFYNAMGSTKPSTFENFVEATVGLAVPDDGNNAAKVGAFFATQQSSVSNYAQADAAWKTADAVYQAYEQNPPPIAPPNFSSVPTSAPIPGSPDFASMSQYIQANAASDGNVPAMLTALRNGLGPYVDSGALKTALDNFLNAALQLGFAKQHYDGGKNPAKLTEFEDKFNEALGGLDGVINGVTDSGGKILVAQYVQMELEAATTVSQRCSLNRGDSNHVPVTELMTQLGQSMDFNSDRNHINITSGADTGDQWLNESAFLYTSQYLSNEAMKGVPGADGIATVLQNAENNWNATAPRAAPPPNPGAEPQPLSDGQKDVVSQYEGGSYAGQNSLSPDMLTGGAAQVALALPSPQLQAQIDALAAPVDHSTPPPGQANVSGTEMTSDELDAHIDDLQGTLDSLGDLSDQISMRLQLYQDRRSKFYEALSNIMKSVSDTQNAIVGNLKDS